MTVSSKAKTSLTQRYCRYFCRARYGVRSSEHVYVVADVVIDAQFHIYELRKKAGYKGTGSA